MTTNCAHDLVRKNGDLWRCTVCPAQFLPEATLKDIANDFQFRYDVVEEVAAGLLFRFHKAAVDNYGAQVAAPLEPDTYNYDQDECPEHEGNPCVRCGASLFLGGTK